MRLKTKEKDTSPQSLENLQPGLAHFNAHKLYQQLTDE